MSASTVAAASTVLKQHGGVMSGKGPAASEKKLGKGHLNVRHSTRALHI